MRVKKEWKSKSTCGYTLLNTPKRLIYQLPNLKIGGPNYFLLDGSFTHQKLVKRHSYHRDDRNLTAHLIMFLKRRGHR